MNTEELFIQWCLNNLFQVYSDIELDNVDYILRKIDNDSLEWRTFSDGFNLGSELGWDEYHQRELDLVIADIGSDPMGAHWGTNESWNRKSRNYLFSGILIMILATGESTNQLNLQSVKLTQKQLSGRHFEMAIQKVRLMVIGLADVMVIAKVF